MQNLNDARTVSDSNSVLELAILSVIGDREEQQDSFGYSLKENEGVVVVCDGMGGHRGGSLASDTAVKTILADYEAHYPCDSVVPSMQAATQAANAEVLRLTDENGAQLKAGSTAVTVLIRGKQLYWNSVGDSRAYLFRGGEFVQFTQDQNYRTVLREQLQAGVIDRERYNSEKVRGEALISYLGIGELRLIDYNDSPLMLEKDDRIIVMSDGLYKTVSDEDVCRIIDNFSNINETIQALELKAKKQKKSKRDNMTVALIKIR